MVVYGRPRPGCLPLLRRRPVLLRRHSVRVDDLEGDPVAFLPLAANESANMAEIIRVGIGSIGDTPMPAMVTESDRLAWVVGAMSGKARSRIHTRPAQRRSRRRGSAVSTATV